MENAKLYNFIKETVSEIGKIPRENLTDDGNFQDQYDMDSLEAVEILHKIEKQFKIKIRDVELEEVQSIIDIYNFCQNILTTTNDSK